MKDYQTYLDSEWAECEQYSTASGNCPYAWREYAAETREEWEAAEKAVGSHKSLWHSN